MPEPVEPPTDSDGGKRTTTRRSRTPREPEVVASTARPVDTSKEEKKPIPPLSAGLVPLFERSRNFASQGAHAARAQDWQRLLRLIGAGILAAGVALLSALSGFVAWWRTALTPRVGTVTPSLDRASHQVQEGLYDFWEATKRVLQQLLPGDHPTPPPRVKNVMTGSGDGSGFLRSAVILVPLVILLSVAGAGWLLQGSGSSSATNPTGEYEGLVTQAQALIVQAGNVDEGSAQTLLLQANALLIQAEPLEAGTDHAGRVAALRLQAQQLLSQAAHVARPPAFLLATSSPTGDPAKLIHQGGVLFALERSVSSVYRVMPDPQSPIALQPPTAPLLSAQQRLGEGIIVGTPQFIVWVPAGGGRTHDGLLMLTVEGQLFDFDPASGLLSLLSFSPVVADLKGADGYGGNLYLLDQTNRQIWKYVPDAAGQYSAPPQPWLNQTGQGQISAPIDMVIDGFIYLLDAQGEVARFQGGERKPFTLEPITPPLAQPVALAKSPPESTDLFVADSQRVSRFDQTGRFVVEYRAPLGDDWGAIRDIAADVNGEILYVLSSKGIYMLDIRNTRRAPTP
ncbi:MAG: hypothetical protein H0T73_03770 [Ardenticatenales bacterium]|nr:hypothetical protein [Ardenticatenales bacterium]